MVFGADRVTLVGILNVTPDSFSDGGRLVDAESALAEARRQVEAGAHVLDVGGESTRPGAAPVDAHTERTRVVPVVERLVAELGVPVSVDTRRAEVAEAALAAGARVVNDVSGGREPRLLEVAAAAGATVVLGHMRGEPATMQRDPHFDDVLREVGQELAASIERARRAGVKEIVADPGIGFGKEADHSLALLARVGELRAELGVPVMIGASRKSFLGRISGRPVDDRELESHTAAALAVFAGADAVRVHDVAGAARSVAVAEALRGARA